ncbi:MAG: signal transduction histidine kinase [Pirellulaceae bacterium]|jgi:signal transduction histidine kinase
MYLLCLAVVIPAMVWLSLRAVELDRIEQMQKKKMAILQQRTEMARRETQYAGELVDLEGRINTALWRIDTSLAPLLAQEAARPYQEYQSFYTLSSKGRGVSFSRSPLLQQPSEHILLHFVWTEGQTVMSPQVPNKVTCDNVVGKGIEPDSIPWSNIDKSGTLLDQLQSDGEFPDLLASLPREAFLESTAVASNGMWNDKINMFMQGQFTNPAVLYGSAPLPSEAQQAVQSEQVDAAAVGPQTIAPQQTGTPQQTGQQLGLQQGQPFGPSADSEQQQTSLTFENQANLPEQKRVVERSLSQAKLLDQNLRNDDLNRRGQAAQYYALNAVNQRQALDTLAPSSKVIQVGVARPVWFGDKLLFARRVRVGETWFVQGCWLNWEKLKSELISQVEPLLPDVDLLPIFDGRVNPGRQLATLPVQLVVPEPVPDTAPFVLGIPKSLGVLSPMQGALVTAWSCLALAAVAVAVLLNGVLVLSERRAAFVSAVTHELRTPLTTFRMYAEMLSTGMVTEEVQRQQYTETLRVEADRLSHLVENVLQYARLERGRPGNRREPIEIGKMLSRFDTRLVDRAKQASMELVVEIPEQLRELEIKTDPAAVEQILFNLVDNATKYAVTAEDQRIHVGVAAEQNGVAIRIQDHGPGVSPQSRSRLFKPFSKSVEDAASSAPGVGLGLALCRRLASQLGGSLELEADRGEGASFRLFLPR